MSSCDKAEDEGKFRRHFLGFFIAMMLESNLKGSCMVELFIEDVDNIERMNWCKLVVDCLVHSRLEWGKKKKITFQGPILFLVLFYVDRVTVLGKPNLETDPIFKGWSDKSLKKRERDEEEVGGFGNEHVREAPTYKRTSEKDDERRTMEDSTLVLKEKTITCEASIRDLVQCILQMDKEVRSQAIFQDKMKAVKMLIGETQFLLHQGEKMDK